MNAYGALAQLPLQLPYGLHEGGALNITDGASDFSDDEIVVVLLPEQLHVALDFVRDVGNHLDGLAQIVSASLFIDD